MLMEKVDVETILKDVRFQDRPDNAFIVGDMGNGYFIQHSYKGIDSISGRDRVCKGRKWYISPHCCKSEVVLTALKAAITNAEHEVRESFEYKGKSIFGPHLDVDKLLEFCNMPEHKEGRK